MVETELRSNCKENDYDTGRMPQGECATLRDNAGVVVSARRIFKHSTLHSLSGEQA
jgi:hypothetical protein